MFESLARIEADVRLDELVVDDLDLQIAAFTSGSLTSLMSLLLGVVQTTRNWEETDEPRDQSILIEVSYQNIFSCITH
jgi:hypothetical protein